MIYILIVIVAVLVGIIIFLGSGLQRSRREHEKHAPHASGRRAEPASLNPEPDTRAAVECPRGL